MSELIYHNFESAPSHVAPFSHAVEYDGWYQLTGQMPTDPDDPSKALPKGIKMQTRRVMDNLVIVLKGLELNLDDVISCRVFITEFKRDYEEMNDVYKSYFNLDKLPARTCVGVTALAKGALVEIDMLAKKTMGRDSNQ